MAKRENGTGTIYQRENRSWVGKIRITEESGKQKTKCFSGKTEAEVKKKIREYNKAGAPVDATKESLETYLTDWLRRYKIGSLKKSSYDRIENTAKYQIIPYIGSLHMASITSNDIQDLINNLRIDGYSYSTIKKAHDCLNEMFSYATETNDIIKNPMTLVKMPKQDTFGEKEIKFFSPKESSLISEECGRIYKTGKEVYPYGDAFILMLHTGLRMGELIALKKSDWNKEKNVIQVRRNAKNTKKRDATGKTSGGVEITIDTTKTYSGNRDIPLNESAKSAIERLCKKNKDSEFIICTTNNKMVPPERFERSFYRILKNVGLEQAGTHSLRHTFASSLFSKGIDIKTVSKLLGHASVQITLNTYIHMIENADVSAVSKLDSVY